MCMLSSTSCGSPPVSFPYKQRPIQMFFSQGSLECPQCSALPKKGKKAKTKTLHVFISKYCNLSWAAQVAQWLKREKKKNQPANAEDVGQVRKITWRRKWQPTPVFLPGKSHGQRSLEGCSPWGCKVSMTEHTCSVSCCWVWVVVIVVVFPHLPVYLIFFLSRRTGGSQKTNI